MKVATPPQSDASITTYARQDNIDSDLTLQVFWRAREPFEGRCQVFAHELHPVIANNSTDVTSAPDSPFARIWHRDALGMGNRGGNDFILRY